MYPKERAVAFLDLLGFSAAVKENVEVAVTLLQGYSDILTVMRLDSELGDPNAEGLEKRYLERGSKFTSVLSMSDCIFLASGNLSDLVFGVAWLLSESFILYSQHPIDKQPPVLFRGGLAVGHFHDVYQKSIRNGRVETSANVIGAGVIEAVRTEKRIEQIQENGRKGPRVWLGRELAAALDPEVRYLVEPAPDSDEMCDLLWPRAPIFGTNLRFDELEAMNFVTVAKEGESFYQGKDYVAAQYKGLLDLVLRSVRLPGEDDEKVKEWVQRVGFEN